MSSTNRPLVTFALFAYRQERYVADAIRGALAQDYRPMEIIIADDASPDDTLASIDRALEGYRGDIPVRVLRNPANIGLIPQINRVMAEAKGDIIVGAAGDDVSLPDRTTQTVRAFLEDPTVNSVYGNATVIDAESRETRTFYPVPPDTARHDIYVAAREGFSIMGASHAWHRRVFDVFGPIPEGVAFEDHAIPFRSALLGTIRYLDRILVHYRMHGDNLYLGATSVAGSVAEWYRGLERYDRQERATLVGRLADLDVAERLPMRTADLARLRIMTEREVEDRTERIRLFAGSGLADRLRSIVRQAVKGMPPRRLGRWILTFLVPSLYLRRLRRRSV